MTKRTFFTGNQLKLIAMAAMTFDHIGVQLFPGNVLLRIIGRLAFPIFACMIAEGCRYTRNRPKYLLTILLSGLVCQIVYFFAMRSLYQCILITFSLSILLVYALDAVQHNPSPAGWVIAAAAFFSVYFLSEVLPALIPATDFSIDYGFCGILLPVLFYMGKNRQQALLFGTLGLILLALQSDWVQWFALTALPLLYLYNGQRGERKLKYLFYIYYPVHLVILHFISLF